MQNIIIQLICPDQKGIIAQLTSILYESNNNILSIEQHVDKEHERFYIRILTETTQVDRDDYAKLGALSKKLNGELAVFNASRKRNVAIMGSLEEEHLYDLLIKYKSNELNCNIPIIIRLQGTNAKEAKVIIDNSGLEVVSAISLQSAADKVEAVLKS